MSRIAYVNGAYVHQRAARVHIEDRGFQFADGVYEVCAIRRGVLIDMDLHLERLAWSLDQLRIDVPVSWRALRIILAEMVRRNGAPAFGLLYIQVTRGTAPRNHAFPTGIAPTLVMTVRTLPAPAYAVLQRSVAVITRPDLRWRRPDIKSVSLLPNVLGKQEAMEAGAYEAWLVDDEQRITEGTASNAWIISREGEVITRPADRSILNGITRRVVLRLARRLGLVVSERAFSVAEAKQAREAFFTGTTAFVKPVSRIDDTAIGNGEIGPHTDELLRAYLAHVEAQAANSVPVARR
jgi:D-alanine transaminase